MDLKPDYISLEFYDGISCLENDPSHEIFDWISQKNKHIGLLYSVLAKQIKLAFFGSLKI